MSTKLTKEKKGGNVGKKTQTEKKTLQKKKIVGSKKPSVEKKTERSKVIVNIASKAPATKEFDDADIISVDGDSEDDSPFSLDAVTLAKLQERVRKVPAQTPKLPVAQKDKINADVDTRGTIYLGHIPFGFFEPQMKSFFEQFGKVSRLRLSRNKKTGNSKHYAFIEFENGEIAPIVAETMNNYLMLGQLLRCHVVAKDKIHPRLFSGSGRSMEDGRGRSRVITNRKRAHALMSVEKTSEQHAKKTSKLLEKEDNKRRKLEALGIDFSFPGYASCIPVKGKHIIFA